MSVGSLVEKATSDLLISPDWAKNLELCDIVNSDPGQAKEVVKAAKKRLATKNPTVQLLTLTVLETLIKNCGDAVHQQVAERDVLHEMVKIVKKKTDMNVRDKILVLLDSWQEAFGGQRGRYPQYFAAYDELRRSGVEFPQREDAVPIFTPPQTHPVMAYPPPPYAPPPYAAPGFVASQSPTPLDGPVQPLSLADLENARGGMEVLSEMLNAIDPLDKAALKEELIVELVEQCQTTQKQVMNLVSTTSDETLLFQALALNDDLQKVLAKRDAIASGTPVPPEDVPRAAALANFARDEEECEDDFAQLSHRTRRNSDQKPTAPSQPQIPVKIPGPPTPITKIPGPPGATRKQSSAVDLLSGDMFGGTQSAQAAVNNSNQHVQKEEDLENLNPFALQKQQPQPQPHQPAQVSNFTPAQSSNFNPASSTGPYPAPWESASSASSQSQPLNAQQQALLYGSTETQNYPQVPSKKLPPPPIKHTQRQQYFQQQYVDPRQENELIGRTQKLSMDSQGEDDMQNPYAAFYSKQKQEQQSQQQMNSSREERSDSLFRDLVDLQSAKLKSSGRSL